MNDCMIQKIVDTQIYKKYFLGEKERTVRNPRKSKVFGQNNLQALSRGQGSFSDYKGHKNT